MIFNLIIVAIDVNDLFGCHSSTVIINSSLKSLFFINAAISSSSKEKVANFHFARKERLFLHELPGARGRNERSHNQYEGNFEEIKSCSRASARRVG